VQDSDQETNDLTKAVNCYVVVGIREVPILAPPVSVRIIPLVTYHAWPIKARG